MARVWPSSQVAIRSNCRILTAPSKAIAASPRPDIISASVAMTISVALLDNKGQPARSWGFVNAWPVSWQVEAFNASKNEVAIEKLEFSYQYLSRES